MKSLERHVIQPFPIDTVRSAFPALAVRDRERPRIYLDNPAGTQVPQSVIDATAEFFRTSNANLGGQFASSHAAEAMMLEAYRGAATFLGAGSEREIVIGPSMTSLTFTFSRSLGRMFRSGDEIILTRMDHEGNISPWLAMAEERGMAVRWLPVDHATWRIQPAALDELLSDRTRVVALNYASNMTGSINDVAALAARAKRAGALVYVDAVQYSPHRLTDVTALGCDFLACSAYKFYGPHLGVLWAREELLRELYAYKVRPLPETLPEKFEVGTPQLELLAALNAAVKYLAWLGGLVGSKENGRAAIATAFDHIGAWERGLTLRLLRGLGELPGITVQGISDEAQMDARVPTVSVTHARRRSAHIARDLAQRGIFVWSGHNYALELARSLGLDEEDGVVRIGLAHYNTPCEVDLVIEAMRDAIAS